MSRSSTIIFKIIQILYNESVVRITKVFSNGRKDTVAYLGAWRFVILIVYDNSQNKSMVEKCCLFDKKYVN